ncbi:MAG: hypothetical protein M3O31_03040 [Acidobacteriota bacterium]|nr:hypothetical protein [Acidobacteriota bacterium]
MGMKTGRLLWMLILAVGSARGQWEILASGSTADLRGIQTIGHGIAWASGTGGTVLRTTDNGNSWQLCATPHGAEKLDFRAVQAFDAATAIVMSSGKGILSQLFKTVDGCRSWTLLFTNPDPDGFWDALQFSSRSDGYILGDPVKGVFALWYSHDGGKQWAHAPMQSGLEASADTEAFAASNSGFMVDDGLMVVGFVTGGAQPSFFWRPIQFALPTAWKPSLFWSKVDLPLAKGSTAGAFSIAHTQDFELLGQTRPALFTRMVVVGGDFEKPDGSAGTAAFTITGGRGWDAAKSPPHGYRSAVAFDAKTNAWITVGPNGTDLSRNDGRNWRALRPNPALGEPADADQHWNALSLPFVVGPHGRIGRLRPEALTTKAPTKP